MNTLSKYFAQGFVLKDPEFMFFPERHQVSRSLKTSERRNELFRYVC
jgi:hypothetical protein